MIFLRQMIDIRTWLQRYWSVKTIRGSGRFDVEWYRRRYLVEMSGDDPVRHYVEQGAVLGHSPHPLFDPLWYRDRYPDVAAAGIEPFLHYLRFGVVEGRDPNPWIDGRRCMTADGNPIDPLLDGETEGDVWLGRRFVAAPGLPPLTDLRRLLELVSTSNSLGIVEMRTPDFVSGWIAAPSDTATPRILYDGDVGVPTLFNSRSDVSRIIGREAYGFMYVFDPPLDDNKVIVVSFAGGSMLHGAPYRQRDLPQRPRVESNDICVHFDRLDTVMTHRIADIAGWIRTGFGEATVEIRLNGKRHPVVFGLRTDVIDLFDDPCCIGFEMPVDVAAIAATGATTLDLEVRGGGEPVDRQRLAIDLAPIPAAFPVLGVFMHIPKTAGISIRTAVQASPKHPSLWLYDRGPRTIADQLDSLSPEAFDDLRVIGGHVPFGLHRRLRRPCRYVTFLREPASYLKSFYLFMKYVVRDPVFIASDLAELVARPELDNAFVRWFAEVPAGRMVEKADLDIALETMDRNFAFVGLVERMQESVSRLSQLWDIDLPLLHENRTPSVAEAARINLDELRDLAAASLQYDCVLHAHAKALFWS